MRTRINIISQKTRNILSNNVFDTASEHLSRLDGWEMSKIFKRTQKELEDKFPDCEVQVFLDSYESTVFWYMVLSRELMFPKSHEVLGGRTWTVHEMLRNEETAKLITSTDLGLVFDQDNMWLAMDWEEARNGGILEDVERCPAWKSILSERQRRYTRMGIEEKVEEDFWKLCANLYSFSVGRCQLEKMSYLKKHMWHRDCKGEYDNLVVLDLAGMDIPTWDENVNSIRLPKVKQTRFAHFFTESPREYHFIQKEESRRKRSEDPKHAIRDARRAQKQKKKRREVLNEINTDKRAWYIASRAISKIPRILGRGLHNGRYHKFLSGSQSDTLYQIYIDAYMNAEIGEDNIDDDKLNSQLSVVENNLSDPNVPKEFLRWTNWRKIGDKRQKIWDEIES